MVPTKTGSDNGQQPWRSCGAWFLGGLLVIAAGTKLIQIDLFERTIDALVANALGGRGLPLPTIREATTIAVIVAETIVGLSLVCFARFPRVPALAATGLLVVFTAVLLSMLFMDHPPSCGCLGSWSLIEADARTSAMIGLARNAGLLLLSVWLARTPRMSLDRRGNVRSARPGFTIVELLVVIVVVAILVGISVPALGRARKQGKATQSLSAQRQCYLAVVQYTDAESGYLPFLGVPGRPELGTLPDREWQFGAPSFFRGQSHWWPSALTTHGIDLAALPLNERYSDDDTRIGTYIWLTYSAFARPEYWVGIDPPASRRLFAGVRLDEALYPSNKGLFLDVGIFDGKTISWNVCMADGSAASRSLAFPDANIYDLPRPYGAVPWRVLTTREGIRGRDY